MPAVKGLGICYTKTRCETKLDVTELRRVHGFKNKIRKKNGWRCYLLAATQVQISEEVSKQLLDPNKASSQLPVTQLPCSSAHFLNPKQGMGFTRQSWPCRSGRSDLPFCLQQEPRCLCNSTWCRACARGLGLFHLLK